MTFLYPGFLFALAAIAIPIIIHLVQLRKPKRILFSNVQFIREVKNITASSRKLKNLLVLLCRIAFISFLVLAFAQPFIPAAKSTGVATDRVKIYIDNSMSTQNSTAGRELSVLDYSIDQAKQLISLFPPSTVYHFFDNGSHTSQGGGFSSEKLKDVLNNLSYSARNNSIHNILSRMSMGEVGETTGATKHFIYSDFQRNAFEPAALKSLDSASEYYLIPVRTASAANVFIDTVYLEDEFIRLNENNKLVVRLQNIGEDEKVSRDVKLFIDDNQASAISLDLEPGQRTTTTFDFRLGRSGTHRCRIEVDDSPVEFDNTYYFTLSPADKIQIHHVAAAGGTAVRNLYVNEPLFQFATEPVNQVNYKMLQQSELLVIEAEDQLNPGLADNVKKFVQEGGTAVFIPAARADAASYTRFFQSLGLPPVTVNPSETVKRQVAPPDVNNPFFRNIFSEFDRKMQMPEAAPVLSWGRSGSDVLRFQQGGSFLSSFSSGNGSLYLFASPFDAKFSNFTSHALFVPVMYKLAILSYKSSVEAAYPLSARNVAVQVGNADMRKGIFKLVKDSAEFIPEQVLRSGQLIFTPPAEMAEPGYYTLQRADSAVALLAFNFDKKESDLAQYTADELKQLVGKRQSFIHVYDTGAITSVKGQFEKENFGVPLWKYCLILCLIFLLLEIVLIRVL